MNGRGHINNWMRARQKDFGAKYGNENIITKRPNG